MPRPRPEWPPGRSSGRRVLRAVLPALVVVAALAALATLRDGRRAPEPPPRGLPRATEYRSLLVDPASASRLLLATDEGLYESANGGVTWQVAPLEASDLVDLAAAADGTIFAAGENVFVKSTDGGKSWSGVRPADGLPTLDVRALAVTFEGGRRIFAALADEGLYLSHDRGRTFRLVSTEVGPNVIALAETRDGVLLASDEERGLLANPNGDGTEWTAFLDSVVRAVAPNPRVDRVLAATRDDIVLLDRASGSWSSVLKIGRGGGAVAWAPSEPSVAYAVGLDRTLYRSQDGGENWEAVE